MKAMKQPFGSTSTADEVLAGLDLRGRRILVTGVSSGLGVETARALAAHGAEVIGTARDLAKAKPVIDSIRAEAASGGGSLTLMGLDLSSLESVRAVAGSLVRNGRPLDAVIANAGVMATPLGRTREGFETQFGTNHLGHFLLVNRLEPLIADHGRVIVVASSSHRQAAFTLEDLNFEHTAYDPRIGYARSKTANILFAVEFDRRHRTRGVRAAAVHPGSIRTELGRHIGNETMDRIMQALSADLVSKGEAPFRWKSVPQGAATTVWATAVGAPEEIGGRYCENCHVSQITDRPLGPLEEGVRPYAVDPEIARQLWRLSEAMVGETFRSGTGSVV